MEEESPTSLCVPSGQKNALDILMASSREVVLPPLLSPPEGKTLRMDQVLHNNLTGKAPTCNAMLCYYRIHSSFYVEELHSMGVGWRPCSVTIGANFVRKLSQALWYLDPHHKKINSRGFHMPDQCSKFTGYNDYKKKKMKEPRLSAESLHLHIEQLSTILMQPWLSAKKFCVLHNDVEKLVDALHHYRKHLITQYEKVKLQQAVRETPATEENASLVTLPSRTGPSSTNYCELERKLMDMPLYEPFCFVYLILHRWTILNVDNGYLENLFLFLLCCTSTCMAIT